MPVTSEDIEAAVTAAFPANKVQEVMQVLNTYKGEEAHRIQMCIVVLSDHDISKVEHFVQQAAKDYRDILLWADPNGEWT